MKRPPVLKTCTIDCASVHPVSRNIRPSWLARLFVALIAFGSAHAADTPNAALDSIEQRVKPCISCHGNEGRATREGYFPRIAGKPAGYLFNQLLNFQEGRRHFQMMTYMAQYQTDDYLREIAAYFGSQQVPYPPPQPPKTTTAVLERGRQLATGRCGGTSRRR